MLVQDVITIIISKMPLSLRRSISKASYRDITREDIDITRVKPHLEICSDLTGCFIPKWVGSVSDRSGIHRLNFNRLYRNRESTEDYIVSDCGVIFSVVYTNAFVSIGIGWPRNHRIVCIDKRNRACSWQGELHIPLFASTRTIRSLR